MDSALEEREMKICDLLKTEKNWCQRNFCLDKNGKNLKSGFRENGVKFCLDAAIEVCYPMLDDYIRIKNMIEEELDIDDLSKESNREGLTGWNDRRGRKFSEVLALIKKLDI